MTRRASRDSALVCLALAAALVAGPSAAAVPDLAELAKVATDPGDVLEWTIGADGRVLTVKVVEDAIGDAELAKRLIAIARTWRFPASGSVATVRYPLVFSPR